MTRVALRSLLASARSWRITRGPNPCLEIYPANEFQRIADEIDQMEDRQMAETLKGIVIGLAVQTELDKQGRVLLPTLLRKHARLNGAAVLMGQIRRFDLWPDDLWNERYGDGLQSIDAQVVDAFRTLKR